MKLWCFLLQFQILADSAHLWESWIIFLNLTVTFCFLFVFSFLLRTLHLPNHQKAKMLVLLAGIFVVHIATVIMLFVSTIANVSSVLLFIHSFIHSFIQKFKPQSLPFMNFQLSCRRKHTLALQTTQKGRIKVSVCLRWSLQDWWMAGRSLGIRWTGEGAEGCMPGRKDSQGAQVGGTGFVRAKRRHPGVRSRTSLPSVSLD